MTTLIEQIEAMRIRMNELAAEEHGLVRMLGDALASADQRLVEEVRSVAVAHEARRGAILRVLQELAGRMCTLYRPQGPFAAPEDILQEEPSHGTGLAMRGGDWHRALEDILQEEPSHGAGPAMRGGDWRRATANIQ